VSEPEDRFDTVHLTVEIKRRLSDGAIWTSHRPATPGDAGRLENWPSRGLVQTAQALLIEALRREAYTMAISMLSQGHTVDHKGLQETLQAVMQKFVQDFGPGAAQDALDKIKT
jgi:hypothetical protein